MRVNARSRARAEATQAEGLSTKRKGDIAELYVASLLLKHPHLEVFRTVSDDGHGADLAVRSSRTGRWYSLQVKGTDPATPPLCGPVGRWGRTRLALAGALLLVCTACDARVAEEASIDASRSDWHTVVLKDCGIAIRLPPGYVEKHWDVKIGNPVIRTFRASDLREIDIEVRESIGSRLEFNKIVRQDDYEEYAESAETIGGRPAVVQRYRSDGHVVMDGEPRPLYKAIAIYQVGPRQILSVTGNGTTQEAQSEALAVIHSITFLPESGTASPPR